MKNSKSHNYKESLKKYGIDIIGYTTLGVNS